MQRSSSNSAAGSSPARAGSVVGVALAAALLGSCVSPASPTSAAPPGRAVQALSASTLDFVLTEVAIDLPEATSRAGFNLDGAFSSAANDCKVGDSFSSASDDLNAHGCSPAADPSCRGGIDNYLPELVDTFDQTMRSPFRQRLRDRLSQGHAIWLLRVTGFDSQTNDPAVEIHLFRAFATQSDCADTFGGSGTFKVDNASLFTAGDLSTPRWVLNGSVIDGKLYATASTSFTNATGAPLPIRVPLTSSSSFTTDLYQATFYANVTSLDVGSTFTANFGGWVNTDAFSLAMENAFTSYATEIFRLMPHLSDLPRPSDLKCDDGTTLAIGGISMGANLTLRPAEIVGTSSSAASGTCGTSW